MVLARSKPWMPGTKPNIPVEIDWKHPFAEEMLFYAGVGMQDLVSGAVAKPVASYGNSTSGIAVPANQGYKYGQGFESNSTTNGGFEFAGTDIRRLQSQAFVTVLWAASFTTLGSAGAGLINPWSDTAWASPWFSASLNRSTTTDEARFAYVHVGSFFRTMNTTTGGYIIADGVVRMVAATKDDTTTVKFYRDGQFIESVTQANFEKNIITNTDSVYMFSRNRTADGEGNAGQNYLGVYWMRTQSPAFMTAFYADPYAHLVPKVERNYYIVESVVTGIAAQTLVEFTQVATGITDSSGVVAQTLEPVAQTAVGTEKFIGTAAQALELITQLASGAHTADATGTAEQTLELLVQIAAGLELVIGTSEQTLELFTQISSGEAEAVGVAAQALELITQLAAGIELFTGTAEQILELLTQVSSGTHTEGASGTAGQVLELLVQVITGVMQPKGTIEQTLELLTQLSTGALQPSGVAAQTLEELSQLGTGTAVVADVGTAEQTLELLIQAAVGLVLATWLGADAVTGSWTAEGAVTGSWAEEDAVTDGWTEEDSL